LVTGASSGIGRGLALALGQRGTHVVAVARRQERLESLVREIEAAGGRAEALALDVSDGDATYAAVRAVDERLALDLVIANAGVAGVTPAKKLDWNRVRDILQTDLVGAAATIAGVLPGMVARDRGQVVAVASVAGFRGLPRFAAYSASKSGLITFCESLRVDLKRTGVGVTTICPGYVDTDLLTPDKEHPFLVSLEDAVRTILAAVDAREAVCTFPTPVAVAMRAMQALPRPLYELLAGRSRPRY
jgi:short-subunit dehydrogenase